MTRVYFSCNEPDLVSGWARLGTPLSVLSSYAYLKPEMLTALEMPHVDEWFLDSGAYTAWNLGKPVVLADYIAFCKQRMASARPPREIAALDVIGDPVQSRKNAEAMWAAGIPAIPAWHRGSPIAELKSLVRDYPKVGLGGMAAPVRQGHGGKDGYLRDVFASVWPARFHGYGLFKLRLLMDLPFDSVDSALWKVQPGRYNCWAWMGGWDERRARLLGSSRDESMIAEVDYYLKRFRILKTVHGATLAGLTRTCGKWPLQSAAEDWRPV